MSDKKHRAPPPTWSPLSPTPLTDTSTVGRKLPGQNPGMTAITDWVRKKYEGEYTKKYDKHPTGDFKVDHGQLTFDAEGNLYVAEVQGKRLQKFLRR